MPAVLIPFMVVPIIPGVTHFRPANALPVVCSFLFGPAAAWGAAIGNLVGDFFAGLGPGDLFGFIGNFLYALAPYRLWRACGTGDPVPKTLGAWVLFVAVVATAAGLCASTVGFGLQVLGFVPFAVLANVVAVNNLVTALVLGPLLLAVLYPRVRRVRLLYADVMGARPPLSRGAPDDRGHAHLRRRAGRVRRGQSGGGRMAAGGARGLAPESRSLVRGAPRPRDRRARSRAAVSGPGGSRSAADDVDAASASTPRRP